MKIHPLLVPHLVELDPEVLSEILSPRSIAAKSSYWGRIGTNIDQNNDILLPQRIGEESFMLEGHLLHLTRQYPERLKEHLIGKGLDLFADLPLAHRHIVTGFSERGIEYQSLDPAMELDELPRHTPESFLLRSKRRGMEVFAQVKLHWLSLRLLDAVPEHRWHELPFDEIDDHDGGLGIEGDHLEDQRILSSVIPTDGTAPTILFKGARIMTGAIDLPRDIPNALLQSLPGNDTVRILDHPLLAGTKVLRVEDGKGIRRAIIRSPGRTRTLALDRKQKIKTEIERARSQENDALPDCVKEWDLYLQEKESERNTTAARHVLSCHMHMTREGKTRKRPGTRRMK